jgi:hypothetical protein
VLGPSDCDRFALVASRTFALITFSAGIGLVPDYHCTIRVIFLGINLVVCNRTSVQQESQDWCLRLAPLCNNSCSNVSSLICATCCNCRLGSRYMVQAQLPTDEAAMSSHTSHPPTATPFHLLRIVELQLSSSYTVLWRTPIFIPSSLTFAIGLGGSTPAKWKAFCKPLRKN